MRSPFAKRMTADELDHAAIRLEEIGLEEERLRSKLLDQVNNFGFTPPRAEKSKRLAGSLFQFTVSRGVTIEVKDAEVERIRQICPGLLFDSLFRTITKYKTSHDSSSRATAAGCAQQITDDVQSGCRNQRNIAQAPNRKDR